VKLSKKTWGGQAGVSQKKGENMPHYDVTHRIPQI